MGSDPDVYCDLGAVGGRAATVQCAWVLLAVGQAVVEGDGGARFGRELELKLGEDLRGGVRGVRGVRVCESV